MCRRQKIAVQLEMRLEICTLLIVCALCLCTNARPLSRCDEMRINTFTVRELLRDVLSASSPLVRQTFADLPLSIYFAGSTYETQLQTQLLNRDAHASDAMTQFDVFQNGEEESARTLAGLYKVTSILDDDAHLSANVKVELTLEENQPIFLRVFWLINKQANPGVGSIDSILKTNDQFCADVVAQCPSMFGRQESQLETCASFLRQRRPIDFDGVFRKTGDSVMCRKLLFYRVSDPRWDVCALVDVTSNAHPCVDA